MAIPSRILCALGCSALLTLAAGCADTPTGPQVSPGTTPTLDRTAKSPTMGDLPTGERQDGKAAIEPAYDDVSGNLIYLLTPEKAPLPTHAADSAQAPIYIVVYPAGSTVGTLNCEGVPGNCPDHDKSIAEAATGIMPAVYGTDPSVVLGHDHLLAPPASGGDFNIAWDVVVVLFTNQAAANAHLTTLAQVEAAIQSGDAIAVDSHTTFDCAVVSAQTYWHGTPLG